MLKIVIAHIKFAEKFEWISTKIASTEKLLRYFYVGWE